MFLTEIMYVFILSSATGPFCSGKCHIFLHAASAGTLQAEFLTQINSPNILI